MKDHIKSLLEGQISDNAEYIKDFADAAEYILYNADAAEFGWYFFLTDDEITEFETASADRRDEIIQEIKDFVNVNYSGINPVKADELLEKWIVVSFPDADPYNTIRITRRSNFEEISFCEAYGNYGQNVGCYDAGCYSFNNTDSEIFDHFYDEASKKFGFNEDILDALELSHRGLYEMLIEPTGSVAYKVMKDAIKNWDSVIEFFKAWREENETHTEVTGWTYHDSHNFKTVVVDSNGYGEPDCYELEEDEQKEILLQMPETAPYMDGFNTSEETEDFIFRFDRWADNPWFCYVERK